MDGVKILREKERGDLGSSSESSQVEVIQFQMLLKLPMRQVPQEGDNNIDVKACS